MENVLALFFYLHPNIYYRTGKKRIKRINTKSDDFTLRKVVAFWN